MKNVKRIIAAFILLCSIAAAFQASPAALSSDDWELVHHKSGSPANAQMSTTDDGKIRLSHEGHYPSSNAGLLYTKPLNIKDGVSLDVTLETDSSYSGDTWYGINLMNRPVYFDAMGGVKSEEDGFGIVLLARPAEYQWVYVDTNGFNIVKKVSYADMAPDKTYYGEGVSVHFEFKVEDKELYAYVDGVKVDCDFGSLLDALIDDQVYVGFSMSQNECLFQSFVIDALNGELPASEGAHLDGNTDTKSDGPVIDFDNVTEFVLADFTKPEALLNLNTNDCKVSYDEIEGAIKVEITGSDPYIYIPMTKGLFFDSYRFTVAKLEYKTDVDNFTGEFYFTSNVVPDMSLCSVQYDSKGTNGQWAVIEQEMDESENWIEQIRSFRIDPVTPGTEGQVFYYKTLTIAEYDEPETEPTQTDAKTSDTEKAPDSEVNTTADKITDKTAETTEEIKQQGGANTALIIGIIIVAVVLVAAICVVIIIQKKKKA